MTTFGHRLMLTSERLKSLLNYDSNTGVFTWSVNKGKIRAGTKADSRNAIGYVQIQIDGENYLGRLAWLYVTGEWPKFSVDHINCQRADNRIENLRDIPHAANIQNVKRAPKSSTCGFLGVSRSGNRWRAYINVAGKNKHLGCFATPEQAHEKYLEAKRSLHVGCTI